jgi:hypothetical protein
MYLTFRHFVSPFISISQLLSVFSNFYQHFLANVEKSGEQAKKNRLNNSYQAVFYP